ncbi:MAG: S41 family peptidase [Phycisphaerales bacterium]|jgi:carboxyl-terminal processing protease|nr:S41 family peptidase [Phycisphaerales bacterium]
MTRRSRFMPILLVLLTTLAAVQLALALHSATPSYDFYDPLIDVHRLVVNRHIAEPDQEAMQEAAINAMLESLDDPYSVYIPSREIDTFTKDLEGDYAGIGAEVRMVENDDKKELMIVSPMENSPALRSGILAGDIIEKIQGEDATADTIQELVSRLTGPVGTQVDLLVRHPDGEKEEVTVTRGHIISATVSGLIRRNQKWNWCLSDDLGIAYIRLRQFTGNTVRELRSVLHMLSREGLDQGIVLDLRDNPGGALDAAIAIVDMFLGTGEIVSVTGRSKPTSGASATSKTEIGDIPILILINGNSASAAEIVAGALQGNGRAAVLGSRSFGKGSVQEVQEIAGGLLKLTVARYDLPTGRTIDKKLTEDKKLWGVDPSDGLVVIESVEDHIERIKTTEPYRVITNNEPDSDPCPDASWIETVLGDVQLAEALRVFEIRVRDGSWPTLNDDDPVAASISDELEKLGKAKELHLKAINEIETRVAVLQGETVEDEEVNTELQESETSIE